MCGRAAQCVQTLQHAAQVILQENQSFSNTPVTPPTSSTNDHLNPSSAGMSTDTFNIAPGHQTIIFHATKTSQEEHVQSTITSSIQTWGICPSDGTRNNPLPEGPSKHFSNLMFNARADTLYSKQTFSKLALRGQTCLWAVDGYFEWKEDEGDVLKKGGGKQPYFVKRRKDGDGLRPWPLWIPGLWNRVKTGRLIPAKDGEKKYDEEFLETFTIITTEACGSLKWLHSRQPILVFDLDLARKWLMSPSYDVLQEMVKHTSVMGDEKHQQEQMWIEWYPVTKQMNKIGFDSEDCIKPIKVEKIVSVKSFFASTSNPSKRRQDAVEQQEKGDDGYIHTFSTTKRFKENHMASDILIPDRKDENHHKQFHGNQQCSQRFVGIKQYLVDPKVSTTAGAVSPAKNKNQQSINTKKYAVTKKEGPMDAYFSKSKR